VPGQVSRETPPTSSDGDLLLLLLLLLLLTALRTKFGSLATLRNRPRQEPQRWVGTRADDAPRSAAARTRLESSTKRDQVEGTLGMVARRERG
jgi:hypothetical protein